MLEGLLKGLVLWIYQLIIEGVENLSGALIEVFNMDLAYFEAHAPVTASIIQIMMAAGWALLIGNLAFQAMRAMASGLGFEGEDPKILFARTFVFSFLLMVSRQICNTGLTITGRVIDLVGIPGSVTINLPKESHFGFFDSTWLVVVVIGLILIFQIIRFFFEIAERYVILATLTIMAPLAFGMGGSKNTEDIFKGWARMYGSMCVMMLMNVVFLKLLLSAMSTIPSGAGVLPWLLFVVAIARVARKVDDLVCRIGLNPARTGDPLGRGLPMMVTMAVARSMGRTVAATMSNHSNTKEGTGGTPGKAGQSPRPASPPKSGGGFGQKPSRQGKGPAQAGATAATPASKPPVGQSSPPGQQQSPESFPSKRKNGRQQKGEPPIPRGKQGSQKPPAAPPGTPTPPPTRPPLKRKKPGDIPPKEQEQRGHSVQSAGGGFPLQQGMADTIQGRTPEKKEGQTSTPTRPPLPKGEKSSQERPQNRPSRKTTNSSGSGETPPTPRKNAPPPVAPGVGETPLVPRKNNSSAQHPVPPSSSGDTPPTSRSKKQSRQKTAPGSGEAPPAPRKNTPPAQRPVAPGSGEAPPASRRNSNPPPIMAPAAESPQSSSRKVTPKPHVPGTPLQGGISGKPAPAPPPPTKEPPQPTPRRKADPRGETPQKPQNPTRPPLNQDRGGKP